MEKFNKEEREIFMKKNISATFGKLGRLFLDLGDKKYIYIFGRIYRFRPYKFAWNQKFGDNSFQTIVKKLEFSYQIPDNRSTFLVKIAFMKVVGCKLFKNKTKMSFTVDLTIFSNMYEKTSKQLFLFILWLLFEEICGTLK